ncbi:helix-turn-helix domain-containing protein [Leuconostoc mesenteroides subsp. mesenteroides]|uniref:helix-turn-helix domain-containing protein n=1 Tax=Leuconostoc mesenteroides TaxID=1245 RepID=UPI000E08D832|nr:helix-turn-helix domain-containing protein [Leuconostoc mesenteroides]RDF88663.1 helix-turn-helix domain-containing protein [Leuconostoc mesenteroides subsp. mesenteroides]
MGYTKWTDELKKRVQELHNKGMASPEIVESLYAETGIYYPVRSVRRYMNPKQPHPHNDENDHFSIEPKYSYGSDGKVDDIKITAKYLLLNEQTQKTPEDILEYLNLDVNDWRIVSAIPNQWTTPTDNGPKWNFQLKVNVKPKLDDELTFEDITEILKQEIEPYTVKQVAHSAHNLVIPLPDLHFGVTKRQDVQNHLDRMLDVINKGYKTIVIEQLGDLFHSSQMWSSQTLKGTLLDEVNMVAAWNDAKWLFDVLVTATLKNSTKVYVKQMAGNHSGNMEFAFMEYLQAKYPQVVVHNNIKFRDAYLLDNVGIMLAHGDLAPKNLPMLFANEFGGVWSLSHSREIHKGHFHNEKTVDNGGVISRQLGTVKPNDKYEIMNGWTLSKKELYALEYDSDKLVAEWHV